MPKRKESINITLGNSELAPLFSVNKYDDLELEIAIKDITLTNESFISFRLLKPNRMLVEEKQSNISIIDNKIKVIVSNGAFDIPGIMRGQLKITDTDGTVSTAVYIFTVKDTITSDDTVINTIGIDTIDKKIIEVDDKLYEFDVNSIEKLKKLDEEKEEKLNSVQEDYDNLRGGLLASDKVVYFQNEINKTNASLDTKASKIDINILENSKATKTEVDTERKRIDNFVKLPSGSTTGDAELIDGRLGANGITYNTIGESIRDQFNLINSSVHGGEIIISQGTTNLYNKNTVSDLKIAASTSSKIYVSFTTTGFILPIIPNSTVTIEKISSVRFVVSTANVSPTANGAYLTRYGYGSSTTKATITTESNANYLFIEFLDTADTLTADVIKSSIKVYYGTSWSEPVKQQVGGLEQTVNSLNRIGKIKKYRYLTLTFSGKTLSNNLILLGSNDLRVFDLIEKQGVYNTNNTVLTGVKNTMRDPSLIQIGEYYYMTYTIIGFGTGSNCIGICRTKDFYYWEELNNLSFVGDSSTEYPYVWAPSWFRDGQDVYIVASCRNNDISAFSTVICKYDSDAHTLAQGVTLINDSIDYHMYKENNSYYLIGAGGRIYKSSFITKGFTKIALGNNPSLHEGDFLIKKDNGSWRWYRQEIASRNSENTSHIVYRDSNSLEGVWSDDKYVLYSKEALDYIKPITNATNGEYFHWTIFDFAHQNENNNEYY